MKDDEEEIVSDWKFAAMVIDRNTLIQYHNHIFTEPSRFYSPVDQSIPVFMVEDWQWTRACCKGCPWPGGTRLNVKLTVSA